METRILLTCLFLVAGPTLAQKSNCFHKMTSERGRFHSPMYPIRYPPNSRCEYRIRSPPEYFIEIEFASFRLEPASGDRRSDFIRILDGGSKNRRQEVTYDGVMETPFTFRSESNRVSIVFESDELFEYSGFAATYKRVKKCQPPKIANGKVDCDVDHLDLATRCNVTCVGDDVIRRVECREGEFPEVRCARTCSLRSLERYKPRDCVTDNVTGEIVSCEYSCPDKYVDTGSGTLRCENGSLLRKPECLPDLAEDCDSNSTDCDSEELRAVLESSRHFGLQLARSSGGYDWCDGEVCRLSKRARRYYWPCKIYAKKCQLWFNEGKKKHKQRKQMCKICQKASCGRFHSVVER